MRDTKTYPALIKDEEKAVRDYTRLAKYNRRFGDIKTAKVYEQLARSEKGHAKKLRALYMRL